MRLEVEVLVDKAMLALLWLVITFLGGTTLFGVLEHEAGRVLAAVWIAAACASFVVWKLK